MFCTSVLCWFPVWQVSRPSWWSSFSLLLWVTGVPNFNVFIHLSFSITLFASRLRNPSLPWSRKGILPYFLLRVSVLCRLHLAFPSGSKVKNPPAMQETWFNLWVGKIPWRWKWQPTPVFLTGESHGQMSLVGYSLRGGKGVRRDSSTIQ